MGKRKTVWRLVRYTALKWYDDNIARMAAALAYYTLFSLAPAFVIIVVIGGAIFGEESVKGQIVEQLQGLVGYATAVSIQKMIEAGRALTTVSVSNIVGLGVILYAATNAFTQLKFKLNEIWGVPTPERHWLLMFFINRIFALVMVLVVGILMLVMVMVDITLAGFHDLLADYSQIFEKVVIWNMASFLASFAIVTLLFAAIYKFLPDAIIAWGDVFPGAAVTAFIFSVSKFLIGLFLARSQMITLFGAASSFVVILIWVNFSAHILLLGAAFCHNYALEVGSWQTRLPGERAAQP